MKRLVTAAMVLALAGAASSATAGEAALGWGLKIPMRDGVNLAATRYLPADQKSPQPCVFTLTPYIADSYHDRGVYFASHGYPFLTVDVRGRGNSEGTFRPLIQEAQDAYDVVEWLAKQPYCNGKVAMWGGSYAGYDQWAAAKERPPHLATIVPVASPYMAVDFPNSHLIFGTYAVQWLNFTSGHTSQGRIFGDMAFWNGAYRRWFESGAALRDLDTMTGTPSATFQEWIAHPQAGPYWDAYNPTAAQYAALDIPILTITGMYDDDQGGALTHYREYMRAASSAGRDRHYLVIGPWDHAGTRTPRDEVGGVKFGPASLLDLGKLHLDWYAWTMQGGPKPEFLNKPVAYYVTGAEVWRHADSLEAVTRETRPLYLGSSGGGASDVLASGQLSADKAQASGALDRYVYDPLDVSIAATEVQVDPESKTDQRLVYARAGRQLVFHTKAFDKAVELSGSLRLEAWLAIDQPDTDFVASVYEIRSDGSSVPLGSDMMRARYRQGARAPALIKTKEPLLYDFKSFPFFSRQVAQGSRLRLVIGPVQSIYLEKNYNAGGVVAEETAKDARPVTVKLFHDKAHPSALYLPIGAGGDAP